MPAPPPAPHAFSPEVRALLEQAGWYPGRRTAALDLPAGVAYPAFAHELLAEFAGLRVGGGGPGHTVARSGVAFTGRRGPEADNDLETPLYSIGHLEPVMDF